MNNFVKETWLKEEIEKLKEATKIKEFELKIYKEYGETWQKEMADTLFEIFNSTKKDEEVDMAIAEQGELLEKEYREIQAGAKNKKPTEEEIQKIMRLQIKSVTLAGFLKTIETLSVEEKEEITHEV